MLAVPQRRRSRLSHATSGDSSEAAAEALGHRLPSAPLPPEDQLDAMQLVPQLSGITVPHPHHTTIPIPIPPPHAPVPTLSGSLLNCDSHSVDLDLKELRSSLPRIKSLKPSFNLGPHLQDISLTPASRHSPQLQDISLTPTSGRGMRASPHLSGAFDPSTPQFASEQRWPESATGSPLSCGTPGAGGLLGMDSMFNVDEFRHHASAASNFGSSCDTPCPSELLAAAGLRPDLSMSPVTGQTYADFSLEEQAAPMQYSSNGLYCQRSASSDASMSTGPNSPLLQAPAAARLLLSPAGSPLAAPGARRQQRKEQQASPKPRLVMG